MSEVARILAKPPMHDNSSASTNIHPGDDILLRELKTLLRAVV
jgi:hypothetical protein